MPLNGDKLGDECPVIQYISLYIHGVLVFDFIFLPWMVRRTWV